MNGKVSLSMVAADKKQIERLLKTAKGQMEGILKMVEEDRYCIDIANQLLSVEAIIKKSRHQILKGHLEHCVKHALDEKDLEAKIEELEKILEKMG